MTDQEMKIAIAEKCGWRWKPCALSKDNPFVQWTNGQDEREFRNLPDYPNDLNAVHAAEEQVKQDKDLWLEWGNQLFAVTKPGANNPFACYHATARQRCETLLRTWGLWKE